MADTRVTLCGIELSNPVIPASGTFGYGREFAALYDLDQVRKQQLELDMEQQTGSK